MERDWTGSCTLPSDDGFRNEQDLADNVWLCAISDCVRSGWFVVWEIQKGII